MIAGSWYQRATVRHQALACIAKRRTAVMTMTRAFIRYLGFEFRSRPLRHGGNDSQSHLKRRDCLFDVHPVSAAQATLTSASCQRLIPFGASQG
jgi:hypothetical protein